MKGTRKFRVLQYQQQQMSDDVMCLVLHVLLITADLVVDRWNANDSACRLLLLLAYTHVGYTRFSSPTLSSPHFPYLCKAIIVTFA